METLYTVIGMAGTFGSLYWFVTRGLDHPTDNKSKDESKKR